MPIETQNAWQRWAPVVYYGGLGLLLFIIVSKGMLDIIPGTVGRHISADSEGYLLALALPAWIEFVRPRIAGRRNEWAITLATSALLLVISIWYYNTTHVVSGFKTLNETTFALVLLIPYVQLSRRPSRLVAALLAAVVVVVTVLLDHSSLVRFPTALAEGFVMLILAPIAFDIADRGILRPGHPSPTWMRATWFAALVVLPLAFIAIRHGHPHGAVGHFITFNTRAQEAWVGFILITAYFAVRRSPRLNQPAAIPSGTA